MRQRGKRDSQQLREIRNLLCLGCKVTVAGVCEDVIETHQPSLDVEQRVLALVAIIDLSNGVVEGAVSNVKEQHAAPDFAACCMTVIEEHLS